jgi:hypothetical protein
MSNWLDCAFGHFAGWLKNGVRILAATADAHIFYKDKFVMNRLSLAEKTVYPSCLLLQKRSRQLTARWIVVDEKLVCKWIVE